ncbi:hypothetical protein AB0N89_12870 [Amycolatopsis sp. NPDC089917]|uniref:hypothetical protein n=1 Tax=Amycolatopsis sp. NPDC089917 TaxID=3155187 RepID=UPI003432B239
MSPSGRLVGWTVFRAGDSYLSGAGTFYATARSAGGTWLVRGDLRSRTLTTLRRNVECPSLAPDGTRVAYEFRDGDRWRLADPAHLDDQPQWLDDRTVAYGRDEAIYTVPADGTGVPVLVRPAASSPAVVR